MVGSVFSNVCQLFVLCLSAVFHSWDSSRVPPAIGSNLPEVTPNTNLFGCCTDIVCVNPPSRSWYGVSSSHIHSAECDSRKIGHCWSTLLHKFPAQEWCWHSVPREELRALNQISVFTGCRQFLSQLWSFKGGVICTVLFCIKSLFNDVRPSNSGIISGNSCLESCFHK